MTLLKDAAPYIQKALKSTTPVRVKPGAKNLVSIDPIPGDASARRYFRVRTASQSYILMKMEEFTQQGEKHPFLEVQRHLTLAGVDVPTVLEYDSAEGLILLEDLGDTTLLRRLQEVSSPDVERHLYESVIDDLVSMHYFASPGRMKNQVSIQGFALRFDHEKLMWEMDFMIEHFYQKQLQREIPKSDLHLIRESLSEICKILSELPTVFTHRDFHSRNIMVLQKPEERFVMIDFQDARLGPAQYDLASLLKDSYYQLEDGQVARLLDYYVARWEAVSGERLDRESFQRGFDLMSVQRNLKAIGSFASFLNRRGNPTYLKYIGNTFENVRRTLLKFPQYSKLRETLFHYYYF